MTQNKMKLRCFICGEESESEDMGTICVVLDEGLATSEVGCKTALFCADCYDRIQFDMWSCESEWNGTHPKILYEDLPLGCLSERTDMFPLNEALTDDAVHKILCDIHNEGWKGRLN